MRPRFILALLLLPFLWAGCKQPAKKVETRLIQACFVSDTEPVSKDSCVSILNKRLYAYDSVSTVSQNGDTLDIRIPVGGDASVYTELVTTPGELTIYETYLFKEIYSAVNELNKLMVSAKLGKALSIEGQDYSFLDEEEYPITHLFSGLEYEYRYGALLGYVAAKDTAFVNRMFQLDGVRALFPSDVLFCIGRAEKDGLFPYYTIKQPKDYKPIDNSMIAGAKTDFSPQGYCQTCVTLKEPYVSLWAEMTGNNVNKSLSIVIDGIVISDPIVNSRIDGGAFCISGNFKQQEMKVLASVLNGGYLPARIQMVR